jgi:hypothetical protein
MMLELSNFQSRLGLNQALPGVEKIKMLVVFRGVNSL